MMSDQEKSTNIHLSRLLITGSIHEHTPICVLSEIADAHGLKYDRREHKSYAFAHDLITLITNSDIISVSPIDNIKNITELQYIARFINKNVQWTGSKLSIAYHFMTQFMGNDDPLIKIPLDFHVGLQTPDNLQSINACILYKICTYFKVNINHLTTIDQMAFCVRMLRTPLDSLTRRTESFIKRDANRIDLINILALSPFEINDPNPSIPEGNIDYSITPKCDTSHEILSILHNSLNDIRFLQNKIDPVTDAGSIALAGMNFNIDISKSQCPIKEYITLKSMGRNDYVPIDNWFKYWYQKNFNLFDLSISFNPLFPSAFFQNNQLNSICINEGYTPNDVANDGPYELLQLAYISETFYYGEIPTMKNVQTPINLDNISDIPYGQLLCFGIRELQLLPISMTELIELFTTNQNFSSPFRYDSIFSTFAINKLKNIVRNPISPSPKIPLSLETMQIKSRLYEIITRIELVLKNTDDPTRQLSFTYRNASPDTKQLIRNTLTKLLHIGMYMRGWDGISNYPVVKAPVPPEREHQIAIDITKSISEYESSCRSLGKIGNQINSLPLVIYKDNQYQLSNNISDGLTISDRISIVKDGDQTNNIASCIRLSSNWLCASAHKYIIAIGMPIPFDIFNLRHIS